MVIWMTTTIKPTMLMVIVCWTLPQHWESSKAEAIYTFHRFLQLHGLYLLLKEKLLQNTSKRWELQATGI